MNLAKLPFTAGDKRKRTVNYDAFLAAGVVLSNASVTTPDTSVVISGVDFATNPRKLSFFVAGGTANVPFTLTVTVTDSLAQVITDTIDFVVVTPAGS